MFAGRWKTRDQNCRTSRLEANVGPSAQLSLVQGRLLWQRLALFWHPTGLGRGAHRPIVLLQTREPRPLQTRLIWEQLTRWTSKLIHRPSHPGVAAGRSHQKRGDRKVHRQICKRERWKLATDPIKVGQEMVDRPLGHLTPLQRCMREHQAETNAQL